MTRWMAAIVVWLSLTPMQAGAEWRYFNPSDPAGTRTEAPAPENGQMTAAADATRMRAAPGDMPVNNMSMDGVIARFGEPARKAPAVGKPPITRWYYDAYTVYFEFDRVIISVVN